MKKHGFTLAEVLITLGIVGVVAALTMPALMQNVGGAKIGPKLAKFVNTFEAAAEAARIEEGVNKLSSYGKNTVDGNYCLFLDTLSKYMVMTNVPENKAKIKPVSPDGGSVSTTAYGSDVTTWQLKDGTIMILLQDSEKLANESGYPSSGTYSGYVASLLVDIGGLEGKHRTGKEVFRFIVDDSGILIPYGGNTHDKLKSLGDKRPECKPAGTSLSDGYACTGAFADNGWKAPKNY